jgi:hypothetical protein
LEGKRPTDAVFVWDKKRGNLASKTVRDVLAAGKWELKDTDFLDVAEVVVQVQHEGKPVSAAVVSLNDGRRTSQELLDPSLKGEVRFFAVKPGSLKVKVEYKSQGKDAQPVTQIMEAPLSRTDAVPTLKVSLPEPVEVVAPATGTKPTDEGEGTAKGGGEAKGDGAEKEKEEPKGNAFGSILAYLIGLGIAVGVAWFAIQYFKKNPDTVGSKLEQLGVQIPKPQDDNMASADPIPPTPVRPAPPQKIMLDDADPTPLGTAPFAPTAVAAAPSITGEPRLVASNGDAMPLPEGETVVGREVGIGLSLVGESTVSRRHAQLLKTGDTVVVRDLGSTNGTYVNGAKIDSDVTLRPGDAVQFGSVQFRFEG